MHVLAVDRRARKSVIGILRDHDDIEARAKPVEHIRHQEASDRLP